MSNQPRKIYRQVILDIKTGQTLSEDSYEYDGPVAECKGENAIFRQQQQQSFSNLGGASDAQMGLFNSLNGMMVDRFGQNSEVLNILQKNLQNTVGMGSGVNRLNGRWWDVGGGAGNGTGTGGAGGGGGVGGIRGGGGGGGSNPYSNLTFNSGFNEGDYQVGPIVAGLNKARTVAMSQASEEAAQQFRNSMGATNDRLLQLGITPGSGAAAQLIAQNQNAGAAAEAQANRDVYLKYADLKNQNARLQAQLAEDLKKGLGPARERNAQAMNQWEVMQAQAQVAAQQRAAAAARAAAAGRANSQAQNLAQQRWMAQMKLLGINMQNENYWKSIQALGGLAGQTDPMNYANSMWGGLGQNAGMWGGAYNTGSQGMVATKGPSLGSILGGLAGAALGGLTGSLGMGLGGGLFGGGGRGNMPFNYSNSNAPNGTGYWG